MRKYLNNPYVVGGLALGAVMLCLGTLTGGKKATYSAPAEVDDWTEEEPELLSYDGDVIDIEEIEGLAAAPLARNVFARSSEGSNAELQTAEQVIYLSSVWLQEDLKYTTLNEAILEEGQAYKKIRVEQIQRDGIWLSYEGEQHFLRPGESWSYQYLTTQANDLN